MVNQLHLSHPLAAFRVCLPLCAVEQNEEKERRESKKRETERQEETEKPGQQMT